MQQLRMKMSDFSPFHSLVTSLIIQYSVWWACLMGFDGPGPKAIDFLEKRAAMALSRYLNPRRHSHDGRKIANFLIFVILSAFAQDVIR